MSFKPKPPRPMPEDLARLGPKLLQPDSPYRSEFRDRVTEHEAEARLFERLLEQLGELGMIKRRGRQRTDSLAVLTKVRDINRLELAVETLRVAVRALLAGDPEWTRATVPPYGRSSMVSAA